MAIVPVPAATKAQLREYFDGAVRDALAVGLTSIHDATTEPHMIFSSRYASTRKLPVRVLFWLARVHWNLRSSGST